MNTPLFLLSGLLCDSTVWGHQLNSLRPLRQVTAIDFKELDDITAMAQAVLDKAPSVFALAGHSLGARVALEVYRLAPERVQRIALLDTGIHPVKEGEKESRQKLVEMAFEEGMEALADSWLPPMLHPENAKDEKVMRPLKEMVLSMSPEIYQGQVNALLNRRDATPILSNICCPVLVGVGRQDTWSTLAQHEFIASRITGAELRVFEHSGHMAPFEVGKQVTTALEDWLSWPEK